MNSVQRAPAEVVRGLTDGRTGVWCSTAVADRGVERELAWTNVRWGGVEGRYKLGGNHRKSGAMKLLGRMLTEFLSFRRWSLLGDPSKGRQYYSSNK